jgi:hypothetical protein
MTISSTIRRQFRALLAAGSVALFLLSLVVAVLNQRRQIADRRDLSLSASAEVEAARLSDFFESSRTAVLLLAKNVEASAINGADAGSAAEPARIAASKSLSYVQELYPGRIGEACVINREGVELARVVNSVPALRPDPLKGRSE